MEENLAEFYFSEIHKISEPSMSLCKFFWEATGKEPNKSDIIMIRKLLRMYGRDSIFFAILDIYDMDSLDNTKSLYGLIVYFIKKRLEQRYDSDDRTIMVDLSSFVRRMEKKVTKSREKLGEDNG